MPRNQKGFTLIELLIVVVIIGILAAIAIPKFANTKEKAYVASMKSDLRNLITAQEAYFSDNNSVYAATTTAMERERRVVMDGSGERGTAPLYRAKTPTRSPVFRAAIALPRAPRPQARGAPRPPSPPL